MRRDGIGGADVGRLEAFLPADGAYIVNDREMPDICIQHLLVLALVNGGTFASGHDVERMKDPSILEMRTRIRLQPDTGFEDPKLPRQAIFRITTTDGRELSHHTKVAQGTVEDALTRERRRPRHVTSWPLNWEPKEPSS